MKPKEWTFRCRVLNAPLTAKLRKLGEGLEISIYGGTHPHIGAVTLVSPEGDLTTTEFPGHRDGVISSQWARKLSAGGWRPLVVSAGIHYDHLAPQQIARVVAAAGLLLERAEAELSDEKIPNSPNKRITH